MCPEPRPPRPGVRHSPSVWHTMRSRLRGRKACWLSWRSVRDVSWESPFRRHAGTGPKPQGARTSLRRLRASEIRWVLHGRAPYQDSQGGAVASIARQVLQLERVRSFRKRYCLQPRSSTLKQLSASISGKAWPQATGTGGVRRTSRYHPTQLGRSVPFTISRTRPSISRTRWSTQT
jgi:hypothetical protein